MRIEASKRLLAQRAVEEVDVDYLLLFLGSHFGFEAVRPKVRLQQGSLNVQADVLLNSLPQGFDRLGDNFRLILDGRQARKAGDLTVDVNLSWDLRVGTKRKMAAPIFIGTLYVRGPYDISFSHARYNWI